MEYSLGELHDTRRRELEQVQAKVAAESLRLQEQIADLDGRMSKLDESARRLESGLDKRLSQLSSDTIRSARAQLESALEVVLGELSTRNVQELQKQLDRPAPTCRRSRKTSKPRVSESLKIQVAETLESFEQRMEGLAQQSAERWRLTLAGALNSLARTLGEQFLLQATTGSSQANIFRSNDRPNESVVHSPKWFRELVDLVGIEPTTSSMPWKRAPSCATGPRLKQKSRSPTNRGSREVLNHFRPHLRDSQRDVRILLFLSTGSSAIIDRAPHLHNLSNTI